MMENVTAQNKLSLLNLSFSEFELSLKEYAKNNNVPIIFDEGLAFLESIISLKQPKKILEIGTAIGYSAIRMHQVCGSEIYTIERDPIMYEQARKNINIAGFQNSINIIFKDALEAFDDIKDLKFDMIFIDAAKAQYMKFFDIYSPLLNEKGVIVCDNMLFHGLVLDDENFLKQSRSVRGLIRKLGNFHKALLENDKFKTSIFDIGDGMSISVKK